MYGDGNDPLTALLPGSGNVRGQAIPTESRREKKNQTKKTKENQPKSRAVPRSDSQSGSWAHACGMLAGQREPSGKSELGIYPED